MSYRLRLLRLRRLRKLVAWILLMVLLTYGLSNLWLSSHWATGIVERKLKERTGADWQIGGMTWSPWNGVTMRDVVMFQPDILQAHLSDPVIEVSRIQVLPYWRALLRGRVQLREILVDSPRVTIAIEMLATLATDAVRGQSMPSIVSAMEKPLPVAGVSESKGASEVEKPVVGGGGKKPATPDQPVKKSSSATSMKQTQPERPAPGLPLYLHIKGADLKVVSVNKGVDLFQLEGLQLELPLLGEDTQGEMSVALLKVPGVPEMTNLKQSILWERPSLKWKNSKLMISGVKVGCQAQLGMGGKANGVSAIPFLVDVSIAPQKVKQGEWLKRVGLEIEADQVAGRFRCNGLLKRPVTWRAEMQCLGENVRVKEEHGGRDVVFDEIAIPAVFRQGTLQWSGVRLIGEDVSVLGNGRVSVRDGILSVTRLVVSPEVSEMLSRALCGAGLVRSGPRWWQDLDTPDRKMRDFFVTGGVMDPTVDAGYKYQELPVWQIFGTTLQFIREEMKEEGKELGIRN